MALVPKIIILVTLHIKIGDHPTLPFIKKEGEKRAHKL